MVDDEIIKHLCDTFSEKTCVGFFAVHDFARQHAILPDILCYAEKSAFHPKKDQMNVKMKMVFSSWEQILVHV